MSTEIPNHLNYQQVIEGFYNVYNEMPFQPNGEKADLHSITEKIPFSLDFMQHIFGEQIELD